MKRKGEEMKKTIDDRYSELLERACFTEDSKENHRMADISVANLLCELKLFKTLSKYNKIPKIYVGID